MHTQRLEKVLQTMAEHKLPQLLVSDPAAIFYLTGKWIHPGERLLALYLDINGNHRIFINELFPVTEDLGLEKVWFNDTQDGVEIIAKHLHKNQSLGIDKTWPSRFLLRLMELNGAASFINGSFIMDRIRMSKDNNEQKKMAAASHLNDQAMTRMVGLMQEGRSEKAMAKLLADVYEELGADGFSFNPIIGYGANGADPHHSPDNTLPKPGDSVIIDIGCVKDSYCADMTRTVFYKEATELGRKVYQIVKEANQKAIEAVKPGVSFSSIDAAARNHIEKFGYGKYFTHRTGHSIGLEVHDFGDVSSINHDLVAPGMIFSIEPGIYLPGEVGVRIEDLVLVTEEGCKVLNQYDKSLQIVGA